MGCSAPIGQKQAVDTIPDPTGDPIDPLQTQGNILDAISLDPHIHYFKNQIEKNIMPLARAGKRFKKGNIVFATSDKKQYEQYTAILNKSFQENQQSTTNVLSYLFKEVADVRQRKQVEEKFKQDKYAALKSFVYLYTGDYAYKKVNQSLRKNQYEKLAPILASIKKQLSRYAVENSALAEQRIQCLYRGIDQEDQQMELGAKMYWKGFTSTTLKKQVANRFGKNQYTIYLKKNLPHQYLIIPKELSRYEQEQVLIFPYLYFEVTRVQPRPTNRVVFYEVVQKPPQQDEAASTMGESKQTVVKVVA